MNYLLVIYRQYEAFGGYRDGIRRLKLETDDTKKMTTHLRACC